MERLDITSGVYGDKNLTLGKDQGKNQHISVTAEGYFEASFGEKCHKFTAAEAMHSVVDVIMIRPHPLIGSHIKHQDSTRLENSSKFTQSHGSICDLTNYIRTHNRIELFVMKRYFFD